MHRHVHTHTCSDSTEEHESIQWKEDFSLNVFSYQFILEDIQQTFTSHWPEFWKVMIQNVTIKTDLDQPQSNCRCRYLNTLGLFQKVTRGVEDGFWVKPCLPATCTQCSSIVEWCADSWEGVWEGDGVPRYSRGPTEAFSHETVLGNAQAVSVALVSGKPLNLGFIGFSGSENKIHMLLFK